MAYSIKGTLKYVRKKIKRDAPGRVKIRDLEIGVVWFDVLGAIPSTKKGITIEKLSKKSFRFPMPLDLVEMAVRGLVEKKLVAVDNGIVRRTDYSSDNAPCEYTPDSCTNCKYITYDTDHKSN